MKIGVVGSTNVDYVLRVESFVREGQTVRALSFEKFPGGKGANQAVAASKLSGDEVVFITLVGEDEDGRWMLENFKGYGMIGPSAIDTPTGKAFIEVDSRGRNRIIIFPGANGELKPEKVDFSLLENVNVILLQNEIPFETTLMVAKWARENGKIVVFDPAPAEGIDREIFEYVDYLTPNEIELEILSKEIFGGFDDLEKACEKFLDLGVRAVIAKLGEKGIYFKKGLKELRIEAPKVEAVDTTAAGDVFNGAFAAFLERGELEALRLAVRAASISVTRMGAQSSIPSIQEVIGSEHRSG